MCDICRDKYFGVHVYLQGGVRENQETYKHGMEDERIMNHEFYGEKMLCLASSCVC